MSETNPRIGVSLRTVLADGQFLGGSDLRVVSCASNAHHVQPGDAYVAILGGDGDGHDDALQAVRRGAAAVICERPLPVFNVTQIVVDDTRVAYGRLCQALVGNPCEAMSLVGIAGTAGKSSVAALYESIVRAAGEVVGNVGTLGYSDGWITIAGRETTPPAPVLAKQLARIAAGGATQAIVELTSGALAEARPAGVTLQVACLTNIGRDDASKHGSLENYRRATCRVVDHLATGGTTVLNADDPTCMRLLAETDGPSLTYGLSDAADVTAEIVEQCAGEQMIVVSFGSESVGVRTRIIGDHHTQNCLAAAAIGLAVGIDLTTIARGLETVTRLPGRMERVACGQDWLVMVDAADSPDKLCACLRDLRAVTQGRLICVLGALGGAEVSDRRALGHVAGELSDLLVITSDQSGEPDPRESSNDVLRGVGDTRKAQLMVDRGAAITWALEEAGAGDTLVITGVGDRPWQSTDVLQAGWTDREFAQQQLIEQLAADAVGSWAA